MNCLLMASPEAFRSSFYLWIPPWRGCPAVFQFCAGCKTLLVFKAVGLCLTVQVWPFFLLFLLAGLLLARLSSDGLRNSQASTAIFQSLSTQSQAMFTGKHGSGQKPWQTGAGFIYEIDGLQAVTNFRFPQSLPCKRCRRRSGARCVNPPPTIFALPQHCVRRHGCSDLARVRCFMMRSPD